MQLTETVGLIMCFIITYCNGRIREKTYNKTSDELLNVIGKLFSEHVTDNDSRSINTKALPTACDSNTAEMITRDVGTIESPSDGLGKYYNNLDCNWLVYGQGNELSITLRKLSMENHIQCGYDYLRIYIVHHNADLSKLGLQEAATLCGSYTQELPMKLKVGADALLIQLHTDGTHTDTGFSLDFYRGTSQAADLEVTNTGGNGGMPAGSMPAGGMPAGGTPSGGTPSGGTPAADLPTYGMAGGGMPDASISASGMPVSDISASGMSSSGMPASGMHVGSIGNGPTSPGSATGSGHASSVVSPDTGTDGAAANTDIGNSAGVDNTESLVPSNGGWQVPSTAAPAHSCDFEAGTLCDWSNTGSLDWQNRQGSRSYWESYLTTDHTLQSPSGHYLYFFAHHAISGTRASLRSPSISVSPHGHCFTFWYSMYVTTGRLRVLIDVNGIKETVFERSGNHGNVWHEAKVTLDGTVQYNIEIQASRGSTAQDTGFAIDDIMLSPGRCSSVHLQCGTSIFARRLHKTGTASPVGTLTQRLLGGTEAGLGQWPWMVHMRVFSTSSTTGSYGQCGAALIDPQWILTAAHCFGYTYADPEVVMLYFGEHNVRDVYEQSQFSLKPERIIIHPDRSSSSLGFDLALLQLPHKLALNQNVNTVCLADATTAIRPGDMCVAAGWGLTEAGTTSKNLLYLQKQLISNTECGLIFGDNITPDMLCARDLSGNRDVCQGDSGGPLICQQGGSGPYYLAGVVSFGDVCANLRQTPGVYSRVSYMSSWIQTAIQNHR